MMTFLNVKLLKIWLCISISPFVVHAEKKWKHFYDIIRAQAIDWAYLEFDRFSRFLDTKISVARISQARVKIHDSFSGVVYLSISLDILNTRDTTVSPDIDLYYSFFFASKIAWKNSLLKRILNWWPNSDIVDNTNFLIPN